MSFSGLKTAVLNRPSTMPKDPTDPQIPFGLGFGVYVEAVAEVLTTKAIKAHQERPDIKSVWWRQAASSANKTA